MRVKRAAIVNGEYREWYEDRGPQRPGLCRGAPAPERALRPQHYERPTSSENAKAAKHRRYHGDSP